MGLLRKEFEHPAIVRPCPLLSGRGSAGRVLASLVHLTLCGPDIPGNLAKWNLGLSYWLELLIWADKTIPMGIHKSIIDDDLWVMGVKGRPSFSVFIPIYYFYVCIQVRDYSILLSQPSV